MKSLTRNLLFFAPFALLGMALAVTISFVWPQSSQTLRGWLGIDSMPTHVASPAPSSYAYAVARASKAVVNIYAQKIVNNGDGNHLPFPYFFDDAPAFLERNHQEQSLGSGVMMSPDGYLLTNRHVIDDAQNIQVLLQDGNVYQAHLIGTDRITDLAVLKIDANDLHTVHTSRRQLAIGDVALAIGNPFGIGQTVTMGIISAMGRQIDPSNPETFIQTDAAINFGNSGGALVNTDGELIGINTALLGRAEGAEGISFAIPAETAQRVMQAIIDDGRVIRGWLGVSYTFLPKDMQQPQPHDSQGVLISSVYPGSPAQLAGLHAGDIITHVNKKPVTDPIQFYQTITTTAPGDKLKLAGYRGKKALTANATLRERPRAANRQP